MQETKKKTTRKGTILYDRLLFLLVFLTSFGAIGGALQMTRIAAFVLVPVLVIKSRGCHYAKQITLGFAVFYVFCILSLLWTPDRSEGLKEVLYYAVHIVLFLEIIVFARYAKSPLKSISTGWMLAVLLCSVISFWELTTGNHLNVAKEQSDYFNTGVEVLVFRHAHATFHNYNDFAAYLCFAFPWLFYVMQRANYGWVRRAGGFVGSVSAALIIMLNASRGGLLSIVIMTGIFIFMSLKGRARWYTLLIILLLGAFFLFLNSQSVFDVLISRSADGGLLNGDSRFIIWSNALKAFGDTYGWGTGVGGMYEAMRVYAGGGVLVTHNLFIEIMLQFGVIVLLVFVVFLLRQFRRSLRVKADRKMVLLMSLIALPVYSIISSNYLLNPHLFVLLATIYVFANYGRIKYSYKALRKTA